MKRICVAGSLNVDIVFSVDEFPKAGESVVGKSFDIFTGGGKGANQAFALGRLGADVLMVGKLGNSFYGPEYLKILQSNNVNCEGVAMEDGAYPGIGLVAVNAEGENSIIAYPGANGNVDTEYVDSRWDLMKERDIFLLQLEIPLATNIHLMRRLKELGKTIIFDPAPAQDIPLEVYEYVDYVTPNETELATISGMAVNSDEDFGRAAQVILDRGAKAVIAKAGKRGAFIVDPSGVKYMPSFPVKAVDPTAAGDSFNAGLAYGLAAGESLEASVRFAHAVAGLSTTALGAQSAMPTLAQVRAFLAAQG